MITDDETRVIELLAPLQGLAPLRSMPPDRVRRPLRRPTLAAVLVVLLLAGAGIAIAKGVGAFNGIGAANRPQETTDALDPEIAEFLRQSPMNIPPETARLVGGLPSGRRFYVATDTQDNLCIIIERDAATCGPALEKNRPITVGYMSGSNPRRPPISFGVAIDEVATVSFMADGKTVTVPVVSNVWAYEGASTALRSTTAHFTDGTSVVLSN